MAGLQFRVSGELQESFLLEGPDSAYVLVYYIVT